MGSGLKNKKKLSLKMGDYIPTEYEKLAYIDGIRRGLRISAGADSGGNSCTTWHVAVFSNGRWVKSPESYEKVEIWKQVYQAYGCLLYTSPSPRDS